MRCPADGAGGADVRWEDATPVAGGAPLHRVAATRALGVRKMGEAGPAEIADEAGVRGREQRVAGDADFREKKVGGGVQGRLENSRQRRLPT